MYMYLCISLSSYMYLRGWRYTAKLVLFEIEISKSTKPYPSVSREYTNRMGRCFLLVVSQETSMRFPTVFRQPLILLELSKHSPEETQEDRAIPCLLLSLMCIIALFSWSLFLGTIVVVTITVGTVVIIVIAATAIVVY